MGSNSADISVKRVYRFAGDSEEFNVFVDVAEAFEENNDGFELAAGAVESLEG